MNKVKTFDVTVSDESIGPNNNNANATTAGSGIQTSKRGNNSHRGDGTIS